MVVELYKHGQIGPKIIQNCIDELIQEMTHERNVEILCQVLNRLVSFQINKLKTESEQSRRGAAGKKPPSRVMDLVYIDMILQTLFKERRNTLLESRIRFQIQDLMDNFEKEWKFNIIKARQVISRNDEAIQEDAE